MNQRKKISPRTIAQHLKKPLSVLLFSALLVSTTFPPSTRATTAYTWDTTSDFSGGTFSSTDTALADSVSLSPQGAPAVDSTYDDFKQGYSLPDSTYSHAVTEEDGGVVTLFQGYAWKYDTSATPETWDDGVSHSHLSDDLLYISTDSDGLVVFDTKGTVDPDDDELLTAYSTSSTPAMPDDYVYHSHIEGGLIYVSSWGGLSVIDTKGTVDPSDDELVITYLPTSDPAIGDDATVHSHLSGNLLYISTSTGGLSVIDTKGTVDPDDDELVITYSTTSEPAIGGDNISHSHLSGDLLYISTLDGGLSVIDTKGTADPSDDELHFTYDDSSNPAISNNGVSHSQVVDNLLYVSAGLGISVIDTKSTADPSDDELLTTYSTKSTPAIGIGSMAHSHVSNNLLYVSSRGAGLYVINTDDYVPNTTFISKAHSITGSLSHFTKESVDPLSTSSTLRYRTGSSGAVWQDEFDDGDASNVSDLYDWGGPFNTIEENEGVLTLSDPIGEDWAIVWIDTEMAEDFFAEESVVTAKVRANTSAAYYEDWMFTDEWEANDVLYETTNEWVYLNLSPTLPFSTVGFEPLWDPGTWEPEDTLEIEYVRIVSADSMGYWNSWSEPCSDDVCEVDEADLVDAEWIQYRLDFSTTDPSVTPSVRSVTIATGYETTGTYTSDTLFFAGSNELLSFAAETTVPTDTTLAFEYTTSDGESWLPIAPGDTFPSSTEATSFAWRATLTTADPALSPVIHEVVLASSPSSSGESTGQTNRGTSGQFHPEFRPGEVAVPKMSSDVTKSILQHKEVLVRAYENGMELPLSIRNILGIDENILVRNLYLGVEGEDVKRLQELLNSNGFGVAEAGAGSEGNETLYFGILTESALSRYQSTNGIYPSVGYFGPRTRAHMKNSGLDGLWW